MSEFSISAAKRMVETQGDKRVSEGSAKKLNEILEMFAGDVAEEAIAIARNKDRKTVRSKDVREALSS